MNIEKKKKCHHIRNRIESTKNALKSALDEMNAENDRVLRLGKEVEALEAQALDIARNASLNIIGLGDKKGRQLSVGGLSVDGLDAISLGKNIKDKVSEHSFAVQTQKRYQREAESLEQKIRNLQQRLDQMGCN